MELPVITVGHWTYIVIWALLGVFIIATCWSKRPTYKDVLASTLGISLEALGVELTRAQQALIVPLCLVLCLTMIIRFLPDDYRALQLSIIKGRLASSLIIVIFFLLQVVTLLLAYRGWWEILIIFPGE